MCKSRFKDALSFHAAVWRCRYLMKSKGKRTWHTDSCGQQTECHLVWTDYVERPYNTILLFVRHRSMLTVMCVQNKLLISIWTLFLSSSSLPPFFSISLSVSKFILVLLFSDLIDCYEKWLSIRLRAIPLPGPFIETASTFTVLLTHKPPPVTKTNTCAHTHVYVCAQRHTQYWHKWVAQTDTSSASQHTGTHMHLLHLPMLFFCSICSQ